MSADASYCSLTLMSRARTLHYRADVDGTRSEDRVFVMGPAAWETFKRNYGHQLAKPEEVSLLGASVRVDCNLRGLVLEVQPAFVKPPRQTYA